MQPLAAVIRTEISKEDVFLKTVKNTKNSAPVTNTAFKRITEDGPNLL